MEMKLGPLGDYRVGEKWEETGRDTISHIIVTYNTRWLKSIQFGYVENGALVLSKRHGSKTDINSRDDSTRIVILIALSAIIVCLLKYKLSNNEWYLFALP